MLHSMVRKTLLSVVTLGAFAVTSSLAIASPSISVLASLNSTIFPVNNNGWLAVDPQGNVIVAPGFIQTLYKLNVSSKSLNPYAVLGTSINDAALFGKMVFDKAGNLYGASFAGSNGGGFIYKITPSGQWSKLYSFPSTGANANQYGAGPYSGLAIDDNGILYGTTFGGGKSSLSNLYGSPSGTLFSLTTSGTLTSLFTFTQGGIDGFIPVQAIAVNKTGEIYGITALGGKSGKGELFNATITGNTATITGVTTSNPGVSIMMPDDNNNIYGVLGSGWSGGAQQGLFVINSSGVYTKLLSDTIQGLLVDHAGNQFFGVDTVSGTTDNWSIYRRSASGEMTKLVDLDATTGYGISDLAVDSQGNIYGFAYSGGANNNGTIFEITDTGYVVPEPASLTCLALAGFGLFIRRR